ncbi:Photosystem I chlorophyll a apoprotein A2 [Capsicum annuum]|uniref:photosystem I n=2 Tax=Capsicum annuum TaxID=4072 RepID=A0A2G2YX05_CAPAN|nr:Photosystem I chlorophyll a apoprotein A2 [Capsicum annuum]
MAALSKDLEGIIEPVMVPEKVFKQRIEYQPRKKDEIEDNSKESLFRPLSLLYQSFPVHKMSKDDGLGDGIGDLFEGCNALPDDFPKSGGVKEIASGEALQNWTSTLLITRDSSVDVARDSFNNLVNARYVERCPAPEPFLKPPSEEKTAAKKRGAKSAKALMEDEPEKYQSHFSVYLKSGLEPDSIEEMYKKVHVAIRAYPSPKKSGKQPPKQHKSHDDITEERLYQNIFASHFGQLAIIFLWTSGNLFHVAWQGNFESWVQDPLHVRPIAHAIWDPHFGQPAVEAFTRGGALGPVNIAYSGVYQWWYTIGLRTNQDLYTGALFLLFLSAISLIAGWLHLQPKWKPSVSWFKNAESRLNHHLSGLFGVSSLAWTGHLVHVAIPASRGEYVRWNNFLDVLPHPQGLGPLFTGQWNLYAQNPDSSSHLFGTAQGAGTAILTLLGGFHPQTQSLWLTDIAHHHLAIAFIFLVAGHMYRTNFGIGHSMKDLLDAHIPPGGRLGRGHKGLYDTINNSLHFQLGLALASLGVITSLVAQHMYSLPAYAFIAQDFTTQAALYTHHQYIAGFIMTGAFAHGAIFFIRDYNPEQNEDNVLARMLDHKEAIISHLSWASLFLGFHTLGLYVHNDVMLAFGTPEKQILIEPIFAQWIQSAHGKTSYGFDVLLSSTSGPAFNAGRSIWLPGWLNAVNENSNSLFLTIGPGDFLVHHAIALGLHTTTLILVKGALDARGSKLMPDKKDFGYSFPCDGPGRGGTCDISAWDAFYLAVFWMLNTIGWVTFYWHWKHITLWQGNVSQFNESSTYLMGWLRDYLWLNSSQLINGYNPFGMNSLSVWAWMFLFGHLVWATGFMFLISWRGYWQELIETLAWAHERTPLANLIRWRDKPVALSIVQARLVGLAHFSVGYIFTYAAFLIASTSGKFG